MRRRLLLAVLATTTFVGCIPASEVLVAFDFEGVEAPLDGLTLVVSVFDAEGNALVGYEERRDAAPTVLGRAIPVVTAGERARFEVYGRLEDAGGNTVASGHAVAYVELEQTRHLVVVLSSMCPQGCPGLETCVRGACEPICIREAAATPGGAVEHVECEGDILARDRDECRLPVGNAGVARANGTPCGCEGDVCIDGLCIGTWRPAVSEKAMSAGPDHLCVHQQYLCGAGSGLGADVECVSCAPGECTSGERSTRIACVGGSVTGLFGESGNDELYIQPFYDGREDLIFGYKDVAVGPTHACLLGWDHRLDCYGAGGDFLGSTPSVIRTPDRGALGWQAVAAGETHTCGAFCDLEDGICAGAKTDIYCWGSFPFGGAEPAVPTRLNTPWEGHDVALQMEAYDDFTCVVFQNELWCWGRQNGVEIPEPTRFTRPSAVSEVDVGEDFVCVRTETDIECRGVNTNGELGRGASTELEEEFAAIAHAGPWISLAVGRRHACAEHATDGVYCWGQNRNGQLGPANEMLPDSPTPIRPFAQSTPFTDDEGRALLTNLQAGRLYSCGVYEQAVYCWGQDPTIAGPSPFSRICLPPPRTP